MWILYLLLGGALLYLALVLAMYLAQTRLMFPTGLAATNRASPAGAERLETKAESGERLVGLRLQPQGRGVGGAPLLIGFGGNAWNAEIMAVYLHDLFPEAEVVTFHYRGYAPSGGRPSTQALLADSLLVFDQLQQERRRPVVAIGFSIGSGVAAYLARHRPLAGLILVTPFDSLQALARDHFPWAPVRLLLRHDMSLVDLVQDRSTPTALIAGARDTIVRPARTEALRRVVPNLIFDRVIGDAGHNDLYDHPAFVSAMREALARIEHAAVLP